MHNTLHPTSDTSRRAVLRTAAWSVPAIAVVAAAPAYADSGTDPATTWTITSNSWRGYDTGFRSDTLAWFPMNFTITPPETVSLSQVTAVLAFGSNRVDEQIYGAVTGVSAGWGQTAQGAATWSSPLGGILGFKHTFSSDPALTVPPTQLSFDISSLGYVDRIFADPDATNLGTITFTADGQTSRAFVLHRSNRNTSPTNNYVGSITTP